MAPTPEPFLIDVPQGDLDDLRRRLQHTRWPDDLGNENWLYGVEREWLRSMVGYWTDGYDWRAAEAEINAQPQYRVELGGNPIHFLHIRGKGPDPLPLIATHGWPWTFWDMKGLIGPLTDPAAHGGDERDSFDLVIPSLPGYAFSSPLHRTGLDVAVVADLWTQLMVDVLGYDRFGAYGGDWGSMVTGRLGHAHPEHVIGVEMSLPHVPGLTRSELGPDAWAPEEAWMVARAAEAEPLIRSHVTVHTRDPQTLAYALSDSPVGLAAWIWERRRAWSDCDGDVLSVFSRDDLITLVSIYWLTGTIGSSLRLYFEHFNHPAPLLHDRPRAIDVPTGYAVFPKDLIFVPRSAAEARTNLQRWTVMPKGGHFGPAEQPALIVEELREFFRPLR